MFHYSNLGRKLYQSIMQLCNVLTNSLMKLGKVIP